jgi:hypothetical protein
LLAGSIRVPVPVGLALALALLTVAFVYSRRESSTGSPNAVNRAPANISDFEPVKEIKPRIIRRNP